MGFFASLIVVVFSLLLVVPSVASAGRDETPRGPIVSEGPSDQTPGDNDGVIGIKKDIQIDRPGVSAPPSRTAANMFSAESYFYFLLKRFWYQFMMILLK
jgi:hypothetical protein